MLGGSFIKSIITGTVAKSSTQETRAKAYSIFYAMVNVGSFIGKTVAYPIRIDLGLQEINYYAAFMTLIALIAVFFFYKNVNKEGEGKTLKETTQSFLKVVTNIRLLVLILIVTGFWMIQHQLYASMPKYVLRTVGEHASPEWIANVNPFIVMTMVFFITSWMKNKKAITSMTVGMFLMPISAMLMALGPVLKHFAGVEVGFLFDMHPYAVMMIAGIVIQGLAECFISPRYLEFFSLQAPKGEEGMYLGFSHLHSFISSVLGFGLSGFLLDAYCPDPVKFPNASYDKAHYIWYVFSAIGLISAIALFIYGKVVNKLDKNKDIETETDLAPEPAN
jgi:dipeptide/tripeptide permease